jgi:hypothetical protein
MPTSTGLVSRTTTDITRAAPVPKVYTRAIDGVAAPITIPEPQPQVLVATVTNRNHTDN